MLEELFNLVKGVVSQNQNLPSAQKDDIAAEATNTVASGMRNMVAGGGLESLISMFSNGGQQKSGNGLLSNPIVSMMVGHFTEKLMSKFNLNSNEASNVASSMIPDVIGNLVNKSNDPNNSSFSLENLLNSITGGKVAEVAPQQANNGGGLQDILSQLTGGNSNSGGGGLMDIISQLAGGAQQQQQRNGGGGLMDLIKGFIK
ncbi:MAG: hypothetical protein ABIW47_00795 [Ginsengibacter sp.]|jgi:hypothetical protein